MRLVYCGTPPDAVPPLEALHAEGHEVALVVTQPDRRRGRGGAASPSPVRAAAERLGLVVRTPARAREVIDDVAVSGAELGVVVAFGQLLPVPLLEAVPLGFVNVHFSLLPRWRGAAPVERAILAGDTETGVCIMRLEEGLDTGPVYACEATAIGATETAGELRSRLVTLGTSLLVRTVRGIRELEPRAQRGEPTYAEKLAVEEFELDPTRSAEELARIVRAGSPRPGAWFVVGGKRVKVLRATPAVGDGPVGHVVWPGVLVAGTGTLRLDEVEAEGKRPVAARDWLNGLRARDVELDRR